MSGVWTLDNPGFASFLVCSAVLAIKMLLMAPLTGYFRMTRKAFANPEDAKRFDSKPKTDPDVERVRRAHQNDLENIPLFFVLAPLFLFTGPSPFCAKLLFWGFTGGRILHTILYLSGSSLRPVGFLIPTIISTYMAGSILYTFL